MNTLFFNCVVMYIIVEGYKGRLGHTSTEKVHSPKMVDAFNLKEKIYYIKVLT